MLTHDEIFEWEGFGGVLDLAAGRCRLRIIDLTKGDAHKVAYLKPILVVVSDLSNETIPLKEVSVRSCASHIATQVTTEFNIDPQRMVFVEYYPASTYGDLNQHHISAKFVAVEFDWHDGKALHPTWRSLEEPIEAILAGLID